MTQVSLTMLAIPAHIRAQRGQEAVPGGSSRRGDAHISIAFELRVTDSSQRFVRLDDIALLRDLPTALAKAEFGFEIDAEDGRPPIQLDAQKVPGQAIMRDIWSVVGSPDRLVEVASAGASATRIAPSQRVPTHYSKTAIHDMLREVYAADAVGETRPAIASAASDVLDLLDAFNHEDCLEWFRFRANQAGAPKALELLAKSEPTAHLMDFFLFHRANRPTPGASVRRAALRGEVVVTSDFSGRTFELSDSNFLALRFPDPATLSPGFEFTVAVRPPGNGPSQITLRSGAANIHDFTRDSSGPTRELVTSGHEPLEVISDGRAYFVRKENGPELHRLLQQLQNYPDLLRMTGFIQDFKLDAMHLAGPAGKGLVRVVPRGSTLGNFQLVAPWTAFSVGDLESEDGTLRSFAARSLTSGPEQFRAGLLDLSSASTCSVEIDSAALSLMGALHSASAKSARPQASGTPSGSIAHKSFSSLPGLTDAGAELLGLDWHKSYDDAIKRAAKNGLARVRMLADGASPLRDRSSEIQLGAEDLVTGLRYDVHSVNGWHSLCTRTLVVSGLPSHTLEIHDEGIASRGEQTEAEGTSGAKSAGRTEHIFRWDTYSPVLPDPFSGNKAVQFESLTILRKPTPDSLPQQVVGQTYRHRARTVDRAGNSLSTQEASRLVGSGDFATREERYYRYAPVAEPFVGGRTIAAGPKESAAPIELVISEMPMNRKVSREIQLYPPRVDHKTARRLGVFLGAKDPKNSWDLIREAALRFAEQSGVEADLSQGIPATHAEIEDPDVEGLWIYFLPSDDPPKGLQTSDTVQNLLVVQDPVYIPFRELRAPSGAKLPVGAITLRLRSGKRGFRTGAHGVVVSLPPGHTAEIVVAAKIRESSLAHFGVQAWASQRMRAQQRVQRTRPSPVLSSPTVITLRHATPSPAQATDVVAIDLPAVGAVAGSQRVTYNVSTVVDASSVGKVTYQASWTDVEDDGSSNSWLRKPHEENAFDWMVEQPLMIEAPPPPHTQTRLSAHNLPDTRRRIVTIVANGTSRHAEFFGAKIAYPRPGKPAKVDVPNRDVRPRYEVEYVLPLISTYEGTHRDSHTASTRGVGMRVYYHRRAHLSGEGEQFGIVLADGEQPDIAEYSHLAEDPLSYSVPIERPLLTPESFLNKLGPAQRVIHPVIQQPVLVVGFPIQLDVERNLLFSDIQLATPTGYSPFVRLIAARFQPHSVEGTHISHPFQAEYCQLVDGRSLTATYHHQDPWSSSGELRLVLRGVCPPRQGSLTLPRHRVRVMAWDLFSMSGRSDTSVEPGVSSRTGTLLDVEGRLIDLTSQTAEWSVTIPVSRRYATHGPRSVADPYPSLEIDIKEIRDVLQEADDVNGVPATAPAEATVYRQRIRLRDFKLKET